MGIKYSRSRTAFTRVNSIKTLANANGWQLNWMLLPTTTSIVETKYYSFAGQRVAVHQNGVLPYLHSSHPSATLRTSLGSTALATTSAGALHSSEQYFAYGKPNRLGAGTNLPTDNTYTGQKSDGSGLMYYGARFYDPQIGLFVSPDTIVPDAGVVAQYNRYSYVLGRVMNANDPTGHTCVDRDSGQPGGNCGGGGGGVGTGYVDKGGRSPYGANSGGVSSVGKGNWFTRGVNRFWNWITGRGQHESTPLGSVTNSSTIQASKAIGGLDDLAQRRQNLNIPAAGTKEGERFTVARLDVNGRKFYGQNGDSTKHPGLQDANPRSLGHAERDAFGQAVEAFPNGVKGGEATLYVDREPCIGGCRSNIGTWADQLGVDKVTVISRNNYLGEWARNTGRYRTIQWMKPE